MASAWPGVAVSHVDSGGVAAVPQVGDELHLRAHVQLNGLLPTDVTVQVVYGRSQLGDELSDTHTADLTMARGADPDADPGAVADAGPCLFTGTVLLNSAGGFGYTVRVLPRHDLLVSPAEMGLVAVAS